MRIFTGSRDPNYHYQTKQSESSGLKKSEMLSDLFNNQPYPKGQTSSSKLRLSNLSRALSQELKQEIHSFLADNQDISKALEQIELPEEINLQVDDQKIRKLSMYHQWTLMGKGGLEEDQATLPKPYLKIHNTEKDPEIQSLFHSIEEKRQLYRQQMVQNAPNYYYQAYPETYAFN